MKTDHSSRKPAYRRAIAALMVGLALAQMGSAAAQAPAPSKQATAQSPFFGNWELDLTRMPATYGPAPKRVMFTFEDVGAGQWRTTIAITAPDGSVRRTDATYRRDGVAVRPHGDTSEADSAAFASPAPNALVMTLGKDKGLASVRVYTISADGREMTEAAANLGSDGAPFVRIFHFRRAG